jgi:OmpA-OmpF porin, OOP family
MKRIITVLLLIANCATAQTDFVPGYNVIFEDKFQLDPAGDFPAKWNTSGSGEVVMIDNEKWLKVSQPSAVSPALKKALPENCTIEFDVYMKPTTGVAPHIMFGLTSLSSVSTGDVYRRFIAVKLEGYTGDGRVICRKNIDELMDKKFPLEGYIERPLHVSISVNGPRFRVYLDEQKVVDMPKLLTPEYRKNFFIASSTVIPEPEESIYVGNIRIASGDADARSLLIKQLMEQGSVITSDIQFNNQTNQLTPESQQLADQLGQTLQQNPEMNVQISSVQEVPVTEGYMASDTPVAIEGNSSIVNKAALKTKADKIKAYLVNKFKIKKDRIVTDAKVKITEATAKNKTVGKAKQLLTEIVKL